MLKVGGSYLRNHESMVQLVALSSQPGKGGLLDPDQLP
jgi:hypothetical protein